MSATFGTQLRDARQHAGLTQETLAYRVGVTRCWLSMVERGQEVPSLTRTSAIARALTEQPAISASDRDELRIQLTAAAVEARIARWQSHLAKRAAELRGLALAG